MASVYKTMLPKQSCVRYGATGKARVICVVTERQGGHIEYLMSNAEHQSPRHFCSCKLHSFLKHCLFIPSFTSFPWDRVERIRAGGTRLALPLSALAVCAMPTGNQKLQSRILDYHAVSTKTDGLVPDSKNFCLLLLLPLFLFQAAELCSSLQGVDTIVDGIPGPPESRSFGDRDAAVEVPGRDRMLELMF